MALPALNIPPSTTSPPMPAASARAHSLVEDLDNDLKDSSTYHDRPRSQPHLMAKPARDMVVCLDGTNKAFGRNESNILRFFQLLDGDVQKIYYQPGIGTDLPAGDFNSQFRYYAPFSSSREVVRNVIYQLYDSAFGHGIGEHVQAAYEWLCNHYEPGAKISIVGFSRGAHTARVLQAMVCTLGLLDPGMERCVPKAWAAYVTTRGQMPHPLAQQFRRSSFVIPEIHFVGLFDTVSEIGFNGWADKLTRNEITETLKYTKHVAQALAIDEQRKQFRATRVEDSQTSNDIVNGRTVAQMWFAGVHSDVGGGYGVDAKDPRDLFLSLDDQDVYAAKAGHIPLRWMMGEALKAGLVFSHRALYGDHSNISLRPELQIAPHEVFLHLTHPSRSHRLSEVLHSKFGIGLHDFSPFSLPEQRQAEVNAVIAYAAELDSSPPEQLFGSKQLPFGADCVFLDLQTKLHDSLSIFFHLINVPPGVRALQPEDHLHSSVAARWKLTAAPSEAAAHGQTGKSGKRNRMNTFVRPYRPIAKGALSKILE